ncbi:hypothetical protein [Streptomyces palmae]|uniref:WXG100 family type VII secretion target n=1 Tax=Streptomyces palmae TaxID=1701085 RepID=A0A4Z0GNE2_9ACTN|nr:hypothetical protein [Streptomyces palmae]TGA97462.1 hypothetical protein E4099_23510 [Streptomyces palmae]
MNSDLKTWNAAGSAVGTLGGNVGTALTSLAKGQEGVGAKSVGAGELESAAAQREVYDSWKSYLDAVSGRCKGLKSRMEKAGHHQYRNDQAIKAAFTELEKKYQDTPAIGGQGKGR